MRIAFFISTHLAACSLLGGVPGNDAASGTRLQQLWEQDTLTGDWSGVRERLEQKGVKVTAAYAGEAFGVVRGGFRRGAVYDGLFELGFDADLEKLADWPGAKLHGNGFYPHGASGTGKYARDLGTFSNIDFFDSYRLFEAWFEQSFFNDKLSLRFGQLAMDEEFAAGATDLSPLFINAGFGVATAISGNFPTPIYPIAALGVRLRVEPVQGFFFQAAVYDGNPAPAVLGDASADAARTSEFNHFGTHAALRSDEGALLMGELGYSFNQPPEDREILPEGEPQLEPNATLGGPPRAGQRRGLAGSYKAGFGYHTDTFADIAEVTLTELASSRAPAALRDAEGNWAFYLSADQEVWREAGSETDGLGVFARATFAAPHRNLFSRSIETGAVYRGLWQSSGEDQLGVAFAFFDVSSDVEGAVRDANRADGTCSFKPDYEAVLEVTYRYHIAPWWHVQPDFQWIIHPGGTREFGNALVIGLRTEVQF